MHRAWLLGLLLSAAALAGPVTRPTEIDAPTLATLYRQTLGATYRATEFPKIVQAHRVLESYFAAAPESRPALVAQLTVLKVSPDLLARLSTLRLTWTAMAPGVYYVNEPYGKGRVRYFLGVPPKYNLARAWPLAIHLPQADAFLTQPPPDGDTVAGIYTAWVKDELAHHPDAVVLMPLLDLDEFWGPSRPGMESVIHPLLHARSLVRTDPARVYLMGHGMSGHAVWNIGLHYATYFAALDILAGSATQDNQRLRIVNLRNTLPVVWHDADDNIIPVRNARSIVAALRKQKVNVTYNETPNLGHVPPQQIADQNYTQTLARTRDLYPKRVTIQSNRLEREFNRVDWAEITDPARPGDEKRLLFRHGSGDMIVTTNAFKLDASIDGPNRVSATTENVAAFRLYFTEEMIDFGKPLTIAVNGRVRFEGVVTPSLQTMLDDQLFLGRGWRTFTAAVDVQVTPPPPPATRPRK